MRAGTFFCLLLAGALLIGCAQSGSPVSPSAPGATPDLSASKTLVIAVRSEASSAAAKALQTSGSNITPSSLFNAGLAYVDEQEVPHAFLADGLPQLNTESWRVLPDGKMQTTYKLRPSLTWHDGTPLSAEDFAFAFSVYKVPELGSSSPSPQNIMDGIETPD